MNRERRAAAVMKASARGWGCHWLFFLLAAAIKTIKSYKVTFHTPGNAGLTVFVFILAATGLVTFAATVFLIGPYVLWIDAERLARDPWRMYLETSILAVISATLLTPFVKPQAESFGTTLLLLAIFALGVSLTASFFYLHDLKTATPDKNASGSSRQTL